MNLAALGLHCCALAFSYSQQGLLSPCGYRLLIAVASRCQAWAVGRRLNSCGV